MASPLIANVYLHYLLRICGLDVWRRKVAKGDGPLLSVTLTIL